MLGGGYSAQANLACARGSFDEKRKNGIETLMKKHILLFFVLYILAFLTGCATWITPDEPKATFRSSELKYNLTKISSIDENKVRTYIESEFKNILTSEKNAPTIEITLNCIGKDQPNFGMRFLTGLLCGFNVRDYTVEENCVLKVFSPDKRQIYEVTSRGTAVFSCWGYFAIFGEQYDSFILSPAEERARTIATEKALNEIAKAEKMIASKLKETPSILVSQPRISEPTYIRQSPEIPQAPVNFGMPGAFYALVIGNNEYQKLPKLSTSVSDAEDVAKVLGDDYGFNVTLLKNATRAQTLKALYEFRKLGKDNYLLIYYAGHGWLDTKADEGYWLPVDASGDNNVDWIQNATITAEVRACNAKQILIVADSCYSGKLVRGVQVVEKNPDNLKILSEKKARMVMSSGGLEPVADASGKGNHSVFASAFLDALKANNSAIDGASFFNKIREKVGWNADQIPKYGVIHKSGHDGGDFIFIRKNVEEKKP